ncbi:MAG: hypothetical protein J5J06_15180, partial [Phycisphaerae bacterium]|nr:hypothetical protein [Phycisphaerae bacterium]
SADKQHLEADAEGLYYVRNRWYSPTLGRFLTADPNATGLPLQTFVDYHGAPPMVHPAMFDPRLHLADGSNLYQFAGSNPVNGGDPTGLFSIGGMFSSAVSNAFNAYNAYESANAVMQLALDLQRATDMRTFLLEAAIGFAMDRAGGKVFDALGSALNRVGKFFNGLRQANYCKRSFVAGTEVQTPDGVMFIESIAVGDQVITRHEDWPGAPATVGTVTAISARLTHTGVLWLTFDTGETLGVTPNHELWTYEDGWIAAAHVQPGDHLEHACGMAVAVVDRVYDPSPTFVYDLTVDGTWTFFAGELWVHNCPEPFPNKKFKNPARFEQEGWIYSRVAELRSELGPDNVRSWDEIERMIRQELQEHKSQIEQASKGRYNELLKWLSHYMQNMRTSGN